MKLSASVILRDSRRMRRTKRRKFLISCDALGESNIWTKCQLDQVVIFFDKRLFSSSWQGQITWHVCNKCVLRIWNEGHSTSVELSKTGTSKSLPQLVMWMKKCVPVGKLITGQRRTRVLCCHRNFKVSRSVKVRFFRGFCFAHSRQRAGSADQEAIIDSAREVARETEREKLVGN